MQSTYGKQEFLSINELSGLIGVSPTTLRTWEGFFSIAVKRNEKGARIYCENTVKIFQNIKVLVTAGKSLKEVKSILSLESETYGNEQPKVELVQEEIFEQAKFELIVKPLMSQISDLMDDKSLLMEEKAKLIARVEFLEMTNSFKDSQLEEYKQRLTLIENKNNKKWYRFWR